MDILPVTAVLSHILKWIMAYYVSFLSHVF